MEVSIYIKSRFKGNPKGTGRAAAVIEYISRSGSRHMREQGIRIEDGTRNALSLKICICALRVLVKPCDIIIYIDSSYIRNACRQGLPAKWQQDGWVKADKNPPANLEDWQQFHMLTQIHSIQFKPYTYEHDAGLEGILGGKQ